MSNLDCYYLLKELRPLEGQFVQKVYGKDNVFRLRFRSADIVVRLPDAVFLAQHPPEFEEHPSSFVMLLRKHVRKLERVEQINFDRILRFRFDNASLIVEMLGKGNLVLCDAAGRIIKPWRVEEFSSRTLRDKETYRPPPMDKKHPLEFGGNDWESLKGRVVSALSKRVNLSPFYLEEACARAGVGLDKKVEELGEKEKKNVEDALKTLLEGFAPHRHSEVVSPIRLQKMADGERAKTFSELIEKAPGIEEKQVDRKAFLISQQKKALAEFEERERQALDKAEWLKKNVQLVEAILTGKATNLQVVKEGFFLEIDA